MTKRFLFVLIVFVFFQTCSSNSIPADVIPINQMKFIVYDLIRADQLATVKYPKDTMAVKRASPELYQQVFAIYKISKEDFYKSFDYYQAHADKDRELFDSVSAVAGKKRQDLYLKKR